jgi:UDP-N-acetylmuramyl pentapeptide phosphotransferase/UDP-N-acetylglucosamine-1-phosphate transferase
MIRSDCPSLHTDTKACTPTVAGTISLPAVLNASFTFSNPSVVVLCTTFAVAPFLRAGAVDAIPTAQWEFPRSISAKSKLNVQAIRGFRSHRKLWKDRKESSCIVEMVAWCLDCSFLSASVSKGANLTNGLDKLCVGLSTTAFAGLSNCADALAHDPNIALVALIISASNAAFLRVNLHPDACFTGNAKSFSSSSAFAALSACIG